MCWPIFCSDSLKSSIFCCRSFVSEPLAALFNASSLVFTSLLTSSGIRDSLSLITFSAWWIMWSVWLEATKCAVVARHLALALHHVDLYRRLAVRRGREDLRSGSRNRRVAVDEPGHHPAQRLDAERQGCDVQEQDVLDLALEHAG